MKLSFLIITFGDKYLYECITSIRKFYKDNNIYIIDNDLNNENKVLNSINNYYNINYSKNSDNSFELGAIWFATKKWPEVDKFLILHNSMILIESLPQDIINMDFISFWKANPADYSPTINWIEKKLLLFDKKFEYNKLFNSISGCCCIIKTENLKKLIEMKYDSIFALKKIEAVATELFFGYLISNILKIENISLFSEPLEYFVSLKKEYRYIKKIASGQGNSFIIEKQYNLNNNVFLKKILNRINIINDLNSLYKTLIQIIDTDEFQDFQNFLIETETYELLFDNLTVLSVLKSIRHRMFTKKYFPDYYKIEKEQILNNEKILFN